MKFRNLIKIILSLLIAISGVTSLFYLIVNKLEVEELFLKVNKKLFDKKTSKNNGNDEFWAREILNGGYILFFRHAERDKWTHVLMFDGIETGFYNNGKDLNGTRFGENDYFKDIVCLNKRGKIQAKGMSEIIELSKLPVGNIISSPSCRARQTAELVFGGYDKLEKNLVHKGPFLENENERKVFIKDYLKNLSIKEETNTIITAHNYVISEHTFNNKDGGTNNNKDERTKLKLEEGGFYVISNKNNELELKHSFKRFSEFSKTFYPRKFN